MCFNQQRSENWGGFVHGALDAGRMSCFLGFISCKPAGPSLESQGWIVDNAMTAVDATLNKHVYVKRWQTEIQFFNPNLYGQRVQLFLIQPKCGTDTSFWDNDLFTQVGFRAGFLAGTPGAAAGFLANDNVYLTGTNTGGAGGTLAAYCVSNEVDRLCQMWGQRGERLTFLFPNMKASVRIKQLLNVTIPGDKSKRVKINWKLPYKGEIQPRKIGKSGVAAEEWVYPAECGMLLLRVLPPLGGTMEQELGQSTAFIDGALSTVVPAADVYTAPKPRPATASLRWFIKEKIQFRTVGDSMPSFYTDARFTETWSNVANAAALAGVQWTTGHRTLQPLLIANPRMVPLFPHKLEYVRRVAPCVTTAAGAISGVGAADGVNVL